MNKKILLFILLLFQVGFSKPIKVIFLPFSDKVKLNEAWDLSVDVPRWYTGTIDTIGMNDTLLKTIPFDTSLSLIKSNGWNRSDYLNPKIIQKIGHAYKVDYVIGGTVEKFSVVKRAINTDAQVSMAGSLSKYQSAGGTTMMGGLQSFVAAIKMDIDIYDASNGQITDRLILDSEEKDGGLKVWLPMQGENDEITFHYLSRTPFGSEYFKKSVVGTLMRSFSLKLHDRILGTKSIATAPVAMIPAVVADASSKELVEGKILERVGSEVYLNLGIGDNLIKGEVFDVRKPDRPILNDKGDTLGWVEKNIGKIKVRALKSSHFSEAIIFEETDSIKSGYNVRPSTTNN